MKITRITGTPLSVTVDFEIAGVSKKVRQSACYVEIETSTGLIGHGLTAITEEEVIATIVNEVAAPALLDADPMCHEALWERLYRLLSPRGQTGYASHAIAALDVALWDIKGKAVNLPVWKLLGGSRPRVQLYTTFGFASLDRDELVQVARKCRENGFSQLKMVVGQRAPQGREESRPLREDVLRVAAVREAIGPEAGLYLDANCKLDPFQAAKLARAVLPYNIAFFEEPIAENDVRHLADLRRQTGIVVAAGQNEGLAYRFRDMLVAGAVDCLQPNVLISGGFTQSIKIAGMAAAFNTSIANGGGFPLHNMHLHAGLANGGKVEWHLLSVSLMKRLYLGIPEPQGGWLTLPDAPGLGFDPNRDAISEAARSPVPRGAKM